MDIKLPDGTIIRGVPEGTTKEQLAQKLQASGRQVPKEWLAPPKPAPPKPTFGQQFSDVMSKQFDVLGKIAPVSSAVGETVASGASGMAAGPTAGLAGIGAGVTGAAGLTQTPAADVVQNVQGAMTYQPRTPGGQALTSVAMAPFNAISQGADAAGGAVAGATGSPALGAGVNTAIQMLPAVLSRGAGRFRPRAAPSAAETAAARAQDYVARNTSLDWGVLPESFRKALTTVAEDAKSLDKLDPKALERQARLASLPKPVPATRGVITRDPVQLRNEGNVSATEAGKPIRDIHVAANKALLDNLDVLKGRVRGTGKTRSEAQTPEQVGMSIQDRALRAKAEKSKKDYDALYKKARETEPTAQVAADPLYKFLEENPEVQHMGFLQGWLKRAGIESTEKTGGTTVTTRRGVKLAELDDLRKKAVGIAKAGGTDGYYAGKVVEAIDQSRSQIPAAAKAWREAEQAFKKHKTEFEEQGAIEQLVTNKSRTDRSVALEDTWRTSVLGGSIEDLRNVKKSLLTGGDTATRTAGRQAWRDLRAQTIQHIKNEATKSVTRFEDGSPNVTPASMEGAIKSIGDDKLNEIFGPGTANKLRQIMEATRDVKTEPPPVGKGSPTFANAIAFLEKYLKHVPGVDYITGGVRAAGKLKEMGAAGREVRAAQETPLETAANESTSAKKRRNAISDLQSATPAATATLQDHRQ